MESTAEDASTEEAALDVLKLAEVQNQYAASLVPGDSTAGSLNEVRQINLAYFMGPECCVYRC